jgi:hypothetical protein
VFLTWGCKKPYKCTTCDIHILEMRKVFGEFYTLTLYAMISKLQQQFISMTNTESSMQFEPNRREGALP